MDGDAAVSRGGAVGRRAAAGDCRLPGRRGPRREVVLRSHARCGRPPGVPHRPRDLTPGRVRVVDPSRPGWGPPAAALALVVWLGSSRTYQAARGAPSLPTSRETVMTQELPSPEGQIGGR